MDPSAQDNVAFHVLSISTHNAPSPQAPKFVHPFCHHRCVTQDIRDIHDRSMQWSPIAVRNHAGGAERITSWVDEWCCNTCGITIGLDQAGPPSAIQQHCATCSSGMEWEYEALAQRGEWRCRPCFHGSIFVTKVAKAQDASANESRTLLPRQCHFLPPAGVVLESTNSWFYVPFLHDVSNSLTPEAHTSWERHPITNPWWRDAVEHMQAAFARPCGDLLLIITSISPRARHPQRVDEAIERLQAVYSSSDPVTISQAVHSFTDSIGYIEDCIQEVLIQTYGGNEFARTLDDLTNAFRGQHSDRDIQAKCLAIVLDTSPRKDSPAAIPLTPPSSFLNAVMDPLRSASAISGGTTALAKCSAT